MEPGSPGDLVPPVGVQRSNFNEWAQDSDEAVYDPDNKLEADEVNVNAYHHHPGSGRRYHRVYG
ncbi:hypothetical protein SAMN04488112_10742 [Melghirimyces thermohalophilus]|uniref:Uncharacterized protein n=1 Tax=Melghirimyces thermohalophilus TaxID=1236220 RepID=A0A1G6L455_9BACL|nr:hypothetical protein [Melghirimyces thermohalophilus]SDC38090.1 hypothetical protein SAMN04488112_10742 [Melghirimyces thermohalophilus]